MEEKKPKAESKSRKVKLLTINCHQGISMAPNGAGIVTNGVSTEKHNVDLELHPAGVLILFKDPKAKGKGKLIPYANITQGDVEVKE
jgi:hypothetical protein